MNTLAIVFSVIGLAALTICLVFFSHPELRLICLAALGLNVIAALVCAVIGGGK